MRFIHMADIHLDSPFSVLAAKEDLASIRRLEQREALKNGIEYIKKENIPYLFISGDLFEQEYIRENTIEFINNLFKQIPQTQIFISPGNHDPYTINSFYNTFNWNNNVKIFNDKIETIELENIDIYGYGFSDYYCSNSGLENINIKNKEKINILVMHGSLDASKTLDMQYNPINSLLLKEKGFDYVALGHIHKANYKENKNNLIYPGSLISFGFDELGKHGMLDVKLEKNNININFIELDNRQFEEKNLDISEINSEEELIEKINQENYENNKFYKIILIGIKNVEFNIPRILKLINNKNILKIKEKTEEKYNLNNLAMQNNLKGIFVKKLLKKLEEHPEEEEYIKKALEIGLKMF